MFSAAEAVLQTTALTLRYHLNPWDEPTVGGPVATISSIRVGNSTRATADFQAFHAWCDAAGVVLVSCRLPHDHLGECGFLEGQGFRFIELNYRPELADLQSADLGHDDAVAVGIVDAAEQTTLEAIAGEIFEAGRFHADPFINPRIGDLRYRRWVANAFRNPAQAVWKCSVSGRLVAFHVVESPATDRRFWSLVGLAPGLSGQGMGSRAWRAMLRQHRREGVRHVSTSISSLNAKVLNLYVKLGFRFPMPSITMHWCPRGPLPGPAE
jgi:GNAT superfamily N-acetyltransferase